MFADRGFLMVQIVLDNHAVRFRHLALLSNLIQTLEAGFTTQTSWLTYLPVSTITATSKSWTINVRFFAGHQAMSRLDRSRGRGSVRCLRNQPMPLPIPIERDNSSEKWKMGVFPGSLLRISRFM
jgi:hypothetical protein